MEASLFRAAQLANSLEQYQRDLDVYFSDKDKIMNELYRLENNPPPYLSGLQIKDRVERFHRLQVERSQLHFNEESFVNELQEFQDLYRRYKLQKSQKMVRKNLEENFNEKYIQLKKDQEKIELERRKLKDEFKSICLEKAQFGPGYYSSKLEENPFYLNLQNLKRFRDQNSLDLG